MLGYGRYWLQLPEYGMSNSVDRIAPLFSLTAVFFFGDLQVQPAMTPAMVTDAGSSTGLSASQLE